MKKRVLTIEVEVFLRPVSVNQIAIALAAAAIAAVSLSILSRRGSMAEQSDIKSLIVHVPFVFSSSIDPVAVVTVGDHFVSEHVFASHGRASPRDGYVSLFSNIEIDDERNLVTLKPRTDIRRSDGSRYDLSDVCSAAKRSLQGTRHSAISKLVRSVECVDEQIQISFLSIPVNFRYLLNVADFFLFDPSAPALEGRQKTPTTGAYFLSNLTKDQAVLSRNVHYPAELRANDIDDVTVKSFAAAKSSEIIASMTPERDHLAYFYGYALGKDQYEGLERKGYAIELYPSDWMVYVGLKPTISRLDRLRIARLIDSRRNELQSYAELGQPALSTSPIDRPFGLPTSEYKSIAAEQENELKGAALGLSRSITIATLDEWAKAPFFAAVLRTLTAEFPNLSVKEYSRADFAKVFEAEAFLSPIGQTPGDPVTHLTFLADIRPDLATVIDRQALAEVSTIRDAAEFNRQMHDVERAIARERLMVPMFHFPGVVAASRRLEKESSLESNWGIQAWTYRVR